MLIRGYLPGSIFVSWQFVKFVSRLPALLWFGFRPRFSCLPVCPKPGGFFIAIAIGGKHEEICLGGIV
jgi:hypothetical protein